MMLTQHTPLRRLMPLRRKTWLRARSKTNSYRRRPRDLERMKWTRRQSCAARELGGCSGRVQADHAGRRGIGQKADDSTVIALCSTHHTCRNDFSGAFRDWDQARMRAWLLGQIAYHQLEYERHLEFIR